MQEIKYKQFQKGFSLVELIVVIAILGLVTTGIITISMAQSNAGGQTSATQAELLSAITETSGLSLSSGDGATMAIVPANNGIPNEILIYSGRPDGNPNHVFSTQPQRIVPLRATVSATGNGIVSGAEFAVFFDSFGRATYGPWNGSNPTSIPTCTTGTTPDLVITYGSGTEQQSARLACGFNTLTLYNASGTPLPMPTR
jgi:prepilin-type N-terminal cleavage/methylation domain-containing protein